MKLSFMTFLYPQLECEALISKARRFGYDGIEFRAESGHRHGVELDAAPGAIRAIRARLADAGIETSCLATSVKFADPDQAERDANLDRLFRFAELAAEVGAPCIRVFADPIPNGGRGKREESYQFQSEYLARGAAAVDSAGVKLCLETHSVFRAFDAGEVMFRAGYPSALRINWHLEHCLVHGEDVDEAYRHVKGRVIHAHFSMSPHIERQMELLAHEGFTGYFSLEMIGKGGEDVADGLLVEQAAGWREIQGKLTTGV
jgi:sugar phosphate isomerase/epimerase